MDFLTNAHEIGEKLKGIPKTWGGKTAILEMRGNNFPHWKQMEWIGFYFQFLCEKHLAPIMEIPGPKYGNVPFDGFRCIPWDFKAHAMNTSSHQIIVNDKEAIANGITEYGGVGLILALGEVEYNDEKRTFQKWHGKIKGGKSKYEVERIKRGAWSRLRKTSFDLRQISFIKITSQTLTNGGSFQQNFRNADGTPRNEKVLLDLEKVKNKNDLIYFIDF